MKFEPKRHDGLMAYVVEESSWGRTSRWIVWASSLKDAKNMHGWTRQLHTSRTVHRASPVEAAVLLERHR